MTIALNYVNITVHDVDEALPFYCEALGLLKRADVGAGAFRWVTLGSESSTNGDIVLSAPHAGRSVEDGDALAILMTKGTLPFLGFVTDDVDALFERVRASGAEVVQEPTDQAWGPRDCAFRDPSGNLVRIAQSS